MMNPKKLMGQLQGNAMKGLKDVLESIHARLELSNENEAKQLQLLRQINIKLTKPEDEKKE